MHILFYYYSGAGGGGALSNIILLLKAMARTFPDCRISVLCSKTSKLNDLSSVCGFNVINFDSFFGLEISRLYLGCFGLNRIARQINADVVWSLNLGAYFRTGIPMILSVNNPHQVYPWQVTSSHPGSRLKVFLLRWFFRRSLAHTTAVIVQTKIMGSLVKKLKQCPSLVFVIPKAVEDQRDVVWEVLPNQIISKLNSGIDQWFTFLYVSTSSPHKNHAIIVDAFKIIRNEGLKIRIVLTVSSEYLTKIGGSVAASLISDGYLIPISWLNKNCLKSMYDSVDACLMPSILESLSSAHLEAMQWGKPQIVSDLPYAHDLCGDAAVYASSTDANEWVLNIKNIVCNEKLRLDLVGNGYRKMQLFPPDWERVAILAKDVIMHSVF